MEYKQLSYDEQLKLFAKRGCSDLLWQIKYKDVSEKEKNEYERSLRTISSIGYYQLKSYSFPYFKNGYYENLLFSDIVARYYRDKRLRYATLHVIEDIKATLNTKIAYLLGDKLGSLGYIDFRSWCQTKGKNPFLRYITDKYTIAKEENSFLLRVSRAARQSSSLDVKEFEIKNPTEPYLPVWLLMNELTLGESIHLFRLMSKENRRAIAKEFNSDVMELNSWLSCINLVRNICCHNGNLADLRLKTKPKVPKEYKEILITHDKQMLTYTNGYAIVACILVKMMKVINPKYRFEDLEESIIKLLDDRTTAEYYGFKDRKSIEKLFEF